MGTLHEPRRPQDLRHASLVARLNSCRYRHRPPTEVPDQPDNEREERSQNQERQSEDDKEPETCAAAKGGDIAAHGSPRVATDPTAKHGKVLNARAAVKTHIAAKRCGIAPNNTIALHHNAPAKGGDVAVDVAANPNAATEAGHFGDRLVGSYGDVMAELSPVVRASRKGGCSQ